MESTTVQRRRSAGSDGRGSLSPAAAAQDTRTQGFWSQDLWTQGIVCILLMRSALDLYSGKSVPAAFAIAVDLLVLAYLGRQLVLRKTIHLDRFGWMLLGWVALQGIWVALLPTGALGGTAFMSYEAMREWVRFFSLGMVYVLTMQLRDRIAPDRLASILLLSLVIPLVLAALQISRVDLPSFLQSDVGWKDFTGTGDRINSTLGHYNSFATFTLLFIALSLWRMQMSKRPWIWAPLVGGLLYCLIATKSLTGLVMLIVFGGLYFLPRLKGKGLFGAIALTVTLSILLSTELGQERLLELNKTPLLNPDLTIERAMALQAADMKEFRNSFNWRLLQWRDLLLQWQQYPMLGFGLGTTKELSVFNTTSHNDYVRFLVEEGLIGFGLFWMFLLAQMGRVLQVMRNSLPGSPQRALCQAMFPFSIALMVGMAAGNVMVHTAMFFYWWVLLALLGWEWPPVFGGVSLSSVAPSGRERSHSLTAPELARTVSTNGYAAYSSVDESPPVYDEPANYMQDYRPAKDDSPVAYDVIEPLQYDAYEPYEPVEIASTSIYDSSLYDAEIYQSDRYDLEEYDRKGDDTPPAADVTDTNEQRIPIRPDA